MTTKRKYGFLIAATALLVVAGGSIHARKDDFGLGRNMEITVNMMRELALGYVDPIDPDRLMEGRPPAWSATSTPTRSTSPRRGSRTSNCSRRANTGASAP